MLGAFGSKAFEVNQDKIYTPDNISVSEGINYEEQETEASKPSIYIKGNKAMAITFDLLLLNNFCDVQTEVDWWLVKMRGVQPEYLSFGNKTYGQGKFLLTNVAMSDTTISATGELIKTKLSLSFIEYARAGYKKEVGTK